MPYTDENSLNVFLSYVSEDVKIADAIAATLRSAFPRDIEITTMSEFPLGENWRKLIDDNISKTDILIAIATGRLRPSHSFTGTEVGSFSFSMRASPKMSKCELDRRIIPFAVLAKVPETINEFEGITIDRSSLRDIRFDAARLENQLLQLDDRDGGNNLYIFLSDIEDIINTRRAAIRSTPGTTIERTRITEDRILVLKKFASDLRDVVLRLMLDREESSERPKAKLVIRSKQSKSGEYGTDLLEKAAISFEGNVSEIFGSRLDKDFYTWDTLTRNIAQDIAYQWRKAFNSILISSKNSVFLDDNSILSFDKKKIFRIFISQITYYYNNDSEVQIYLIELLRRKDYGDPDSTLLLNALEVSLSY